MIINRRDKEEEEYWRIYWRERKFSNRLCDWQSGSDRRNNRHESRKKNRVEPHAVRNRNGGGAELQKTEEKKKKRRRKGNGQTEVWKNTWKNVKTGPAREEE